MITKFMRWYIKKRMMAITMLYLNNDITYEERTDRLTKLRILKVKWVDHQCKHLCCFCKWKNQCYEDARYYIEGK